MSDYTAKCVGKEYVSGTPAFIAGAKWQSKQPPTPTHHAVIDEYGEIIYARRISGLLDAVKQCEYYIEQCRKDPVTRHSAKGWMVKEVTLHE